MATSKPKPRGRPSNNSTGRSSTYVHAPAAEISAWRKAAKDAERTLNGWIRSQLNAAAKSS